MARYDVRSGPGGYLYLEVQADLLDQLNTRAVIPLMPLDIAPVPAGRLNPIFDISGTAMALVTQYLGTVQTAKLGPVTASLAHEPDRIGLALDMLLQGF